MVKEEVVEVMVEKLSEMMVEEDVLEVVEGGKHERAALPPSPRSSSSAPFCTHSAKQKGKYFCLLCSSFERKKTMQVRDQRLATILCNFAVLCNLRDGIQATNNRYQLSMSKNQSRVSGKMHGYNLCKIMFYVHLWHLSR